ncbi:MAG: 3-isopropylmalate dehydratase small subunit [Pseudomonadota bacterium]
METFTVWQAIAAPFDESNIDTNQLCPTRFNKVAKGPDYAPVLFHDFRFDADDKEKPGFILNTPPYRQAGILVADRNFGCGSSRESAVYALHAFGIRAVIAPSFGEIFQTNCFKNSVLPVVLDDTTCDLLRRQLHEHVGAQLTVDLERQLVVDVAGAEHAFTVHPLRRRCLLEGLDDVSMTRRYAAEMLAFEGAYHTQFPWLVGAPVAS